MTLVLTQDERQKMTSLGYSELECKVYEVIRERVAGLYKKGYGNKISMGEKSVGIILDRVHCTSKELFDSVKRLITGGLMTKEKRGEYIDYGVCEVSEAQSPLPFDDENFINMVNATDDEMVMLDNACRQLFTNCDSFRQYMEDIFKWNGRFNFNKNDINNLSKTSGISVGKIQQIMTELAYEINPIKSESDRTTEEAKFAREMLENLRIQLAINDTLPLPTDDDIDKAVASINKFELLNYALNKAPRCSYHDSKHKLMGLVDIMEYIWYDEKTLPSQKKNVASSLFREYVYSHKELYRYIYSSNNVVTDKSTGITTTKEKVDDRLLMKLMETVAKIISGEDESGVSNTRTLIKYAKEGLKTKVNKKLNYEWDLEKHVINWWHDKDMEDIRENIAYDMMEDYMRDKNLLTDDLQKNKTKAMELMETICNFYNQLHINNTETTKMRIACSAERK